MTNQNQFAETITKVQAVAGFDAVAQAMQFAKTPAFIEIGTMQHDIWKAEKRTFFKSLFIEYPLAACLCYALAQSMMEQSTQTIFRRYTRTTKTNVLHVGLK